LWLTSLLLLGLAISADAAFEIAGGGARASALGGAFTAAVDDVDAVWFNAAANGRVQRLRVGTTHALLYPGLDGTLSLNTMAAAVPVGSGGVQVGLSTLDFTDWHEQVGAVGYGMGLHPRFAAGATLRFSGWRTEGLSHRSWSVDLGGIYEVGWIHPRAYLRLGAALSNVNRANISAGGYVAGKTPRGFILGAALNLGQQEILIDVEHRGGWTEMRLGYETKSSSLRGATFRLGANAFSADWEVREVDVGVGHDWRQWHFDYAYAYPLVLTGLGGIHRLSLGYRQR
jgi:hypothetical protein